MHQPKLDLHYSHVERVLIHIKCVCVDKIDLNGET